MKETPFIVRCISNETIGNIVTIVGLILILVAGTFLYLKLRKTKIELESCRSSLSE